MRQEEDALGTLPLDGNSYYGVHTARAAANFPLSTRRVRPELIRALALVKLAAAETNAALGKLDAEKARVIMAAALEVASGQWADQFVTHAFQGGAGTSTNMNMNEVLANRANEMLGAAKGDYSSIHPIDHVNLSQSTNDVYPTALKIALIQALAKLSEACATLQGALQKKEAAFAGVVKVGRTELQDALPIALGQAFGAYAEALARDRWRLYKVEERLRQVNLGGTAVGTGLNADRRYMAVMMEKLRTLTKIGLARAENLIDATQNADVYVEVSGLLKAMAVNFAKIAADLRLLASGPRAGLGEINLPARQAGSSIMPGKVNPVMTEMLTQVSYQVMAADLAVTLGAQAGQLELNAFLPLIGENLFEAMELLTNGADLFARHCIDGITVNADRCAALVELSLGLAALLVPLLGYDRAAQVAKRAEQENMTLREVLVADGLLSEAEVNQLFLPQKMLRAEMTPDGR